MTIKARDKTTLYNIRYTGEGLRLGDVNQSISCSSGWVLIFHSEKGLLGEYECRLVNILWMLFRQI